MKKRRRVARGIRLRRAVQIVVLLAFFGLVALARPQPGVAPSGWIQAFFLIDPLILLATWLAAHAVPLAALWALVMVAVTIVLGRVFCGWACPLGTLHDLAGRVFDKAQGKTRRRNAWSPRQRAKYYLLAGLLVMALFGGHWGTLFDPLVLLYRTTAVTLGPALQWAVEEGSTAVYQADPGIGPVRATKVTEPIYEFTRDHLFVVPGQAFVGGGLIAVFFVTILLLNGYRRRFWCRYLCPLGALLGLLAKRPFLRRATDHEACNQCELCGMRCHGAAAEESATGWRPSECMGCLNCTPVCNQGALRFEWAWPWRRQPAVQPVGLTRRAMLGSALGGLAWLGLMRATPQARGNTFHPRLIRPPGARPEREFLQRCTGCGLCMRICPTGALQPAVGEAGLEGLWTPRLVPQIGYCDYECNLCGQVCPSQAIELLSVEAKQATKIGLAAFDKTRCLPYAYGRECIVCEEHCPVPDKAIYTVEVEVVDHEGNRKVIGQPRVDPERCIGCGICENKCVFRDRPAIRVFSANETRHPDNQPILPEVDDYY